MVEEGARAFSRSAAAGVSEVAMPMVSGSSDGNAALATYRAALSAQFKPVSITASLLVLAFFSRAHLSSSTPIWLWLFAISALIGVIFCRLNEGLSKIVLYEDRIEKQTWLSKKSWRREDVGCISDGEFGGFALVHRYNRTYSFTIPRGIERDEVWNDWLSGLPEPVEKPSLLKRISDKLCGSRRSGKDAGRGSGS